MTDLEEFLALMDKFEVEYTRATVFKPHLRPKEVDFKTVEMFEGDKKVTGYPSFVTLFKFSPEGEFVEMGAWE